MYEWGLRMISKVEAIQKLKKMGVVVADDHSIVTILIPEGASFETGLKDTKKKLAEIDYEASFCVKQAAGVGEQSVKDVSEEPKEEIEGVEEVSDEELSSYMAIDSEERFSIDDSGQFTLGFDF